MANQCHWVNELPQPDDPIHKEYFLVPESLFLGIESLLTPKDMRGLLPAYVWCLMNGECAVHGDWVEFNPDPMVYGSHEATRRKLDRLANRGLVVVEKSRTRRGSRHFKVVHPHCMEGLGHGLRS